MPGIDRLILEIGKSIKALAKRVRHLEATNRRGGGGGGHVIQDESVDLTNRLNLNFTGAGVTATDDAGNNQTDVTIPGGVGAHDLLSATHSDTDPQAVTEGSVVIGDATPEWTELVRGAAHAMFKMNAAGLQPNWEAFDWDEMAGVAGADMVHDHSAAGEGGTVDHDDLANVTSSQHHDPVTLDADAATILDIAAQVLGLDTQTENTVWAGPAIAPAAVPTFRALVLADLPADGLHEHTINEDKSGETNGVKTAFIAANQFEPESVAVYLSGARQRLNTDYTENAFFDTITFTVAPIAADELILDYIPA